MKRFLLTFSLLLFFSILSIAQTSNEVEMATNLRSSGKIYVVVMVITVIFIGLAFYLFSIDNRLKKLEKKKD